MKSLIDAATRLSLRKGCSAGDIPIATIAKEAGMSRSTALRRLGGTRKALDEELAARGIKSSRSTVRERAVEAAAHLISERGLSCPMSAIAERAGCSTESIYLTFGSRSKLLEETFAKYSPLGAIDAFFTNPPEDVPEAVFGFYEVYVEALLKKPQVLPAIFAEVVTRPLVENAKYSDLGLRHIYRATGPWFEKQIAAGQIRDLPLPALVHLLVGPAVVGTLTRDIVEATLPGAQPSPSESAHIFAEAFLGAVFLGAQGYSNWRHFNKN
ncbi:TetR/AcrR family transcriptional regulator [Corynebacterium epidermidicanis]|uniref:Transcriptional regulator, TetR family n=1 Tax=Corynebacterium epidermidicanis TaxID=1050174 RepID=A0A0G3GNC1_9CORY|nr:TetR/AcrR family transcriptional regulator [Corynebacterium epidermidicanis]AKK02070.1 transcriptional regulator, TetR family [Corynebacterium epidermidicanis]